MDGTAVALPETTLLLVHTKVALAVAAPICVLVETPSIRVLSLPEAVPEQVIPALTMVVLEEVLRALSMQAPRVAILALRVPVAQAVPVVHTLSVRQMLLALMVRQDRSAKVVRAATVQAVLVAAVAAAAGMAAAAANRAPQQLVMAAAAAPDMFTLLLQQVAILLAVCSIAIIISQMHKQLPEICHSHLLTEIPKQVMPAMAMHV